MQPIDKWAMTDDEIRRSWRQAADKGEQVKIIAELNARSKEDVIKKLTELGEDVQKDLSARRGRKERYDLTENDERKIWKERVKGTPYWKIARMLGGISTESAVQRRYDKMRGDYLKALPTVKKALQATIEAAPEEDRETIRRFIRRYL